MLEVLENLLVRKLLMITMELEWLVVCKRLPISDNTNAQSASLAFKYCPKPEVSISVTKM